MGRICGIGGDAVIKLVRMYLACIPTARPALCPAALITYLVIKANRTKEYVMRSGVNTYWGIDAVPDGVVGKQLFDTCGVMAELLCEDGHIHAAMVRSAFGLFGLRMRFAPLPITLTVPIARRNFLEG